uniref:Gypsy retrotransposon integrase-like protein 1 n=1 Tax=Nothobranchius furzeri TaxID=105023 RepID=A0A8C6PID5_NOTFU
MQLCTEGWPTHGVTEPTLKLYWSERAFLTVQDGLLPKGQRLVIPAVMRNDLLSRLHMGHQGVVKCRERARQSVWWPGLSQQLNELVLTCRTCCQERQNQREPLMTTRYPGRPWQKCGADLFMLKDKTYLLVVDYASRNVEIALLTPSRADDVIAHLKSIFARHGICETLITDNGPQFSGAPFADFAKVYGFLHITSSLRYPQGNAEAERVVQVVKRLLKKAKDPYLALLSYRATLLQNGCRPAQHLMGRRIRTTIPMLPALLDPDHPDENVVELKEKERKRKDAQSYNLRHHVQNLSRLPPGQEVWVTGQKTSGVVIKEHATPHSYLVEGPHRIIRQNHRHLIPRRPSQEQGSSGTDEQQSGDAPTQQTVDLPAATTPEQNLLNPSPTPVARTRAGRAVIKPIGLISWIGLISCSKVVTRTG